MDEKSFIERMKEILKEVDKEYVIMPQLFKQIFDGMIERYDTDELKYNYVDPSITLQQDDNGKYFIRYINENGDLLQILDDNIEYDGVERGIKVNASHVLYKLQEAIKEQQIKLANSSIEKQNEILERIESGEMDFTELAKYNSWVAEQLTSLRNPREYIEGILNNYERELQSRSVYSIECDVAEGLGVDRGPRLKKTPERQPKEEFNLAHRLEGIEKLIPNHELILINNGEYYAYTYDLAQNKNGERGFLIIVEPEKDDGVATRVIHLSQEEFEELKNKNQDMEDIEIRAKYLKETLENRTKLEQTSRLNHRDYGKWLAIMDYYIKGSREINPEILKIIDEEKRPEGFKKTFPRPYLRDLREELLSDKGER